MGNASQLLVVRTRWRFAAFTVLAALWSSLAVAQGPKREVPGGQSAGRERRRDAVAELRRLGVEVDWRVASGAELKDWLMRASRARLLHDRYGVDVDWRIYGAAELAEFEGRLIRAATIRRYGVSVDWRLYSAAQLDELQAVVERQSASNALEPARPALKNSAAALYDPDDVLPPTHLAQELARYTRYDDEEDDVLPPSKMSGPRLHREDRPLPPSRGMR